jgi:acetolactate synthase-1/2/3 large subunit
MDGVTDSAQVPEAAAQLVALLADEGVRHLFINPGTDTAPVQEAMAAARASGSPRPETVLCLHEHIALSAAIAHHMVTGQPQAVMVHVDAGTLNLGGAIHNAQRNGTPVVVFAGRAPYTVAGVRGHRDSPIHWQQEQLDQAAVMRAFGKWTMEVPRGRELAPIVRRAYQVAQSQPSGPAYVMLPREALMEPGAAPLPRRLRTPAPPAPDPAMLAEVAARLAEARRPLIVAGRTGTHPETVPVLVRVAELLGAPVLEHRDRVNFPARHPLYAGQGEAFLRRADAVLLLDAEVPWVPALAAPPDDAVVMQIDVDCAKASMPLWSFPVDLPVTADTRLALPELETSLCRLATASRRNAWEGRRREVEAELAAVREEWRRLASSEADADAPDALLAALERSLPDSAILVEEAVTNRPAVIRQVSRPPHQYFQAGAPALGFAVGGAAMGVKLARPDAPVVVVCGDGAFNFGVPTSALWSAHRAGAPFVTVILNNRSYYASKRPALRLYPGGAAANAADSPETDLSPPPDYAMLARACGGEGRNVDRPADLPDALRWALDVAAQGKCVVLDARLPTP